MRTSIHTRYGTLRTCTSITALTLALVAGAVVSPPTFAAPQMSTFDPIASLIGERGLLMPDGPVLRPVLAAPPAIASQVRDTAVQVRDKAGAMVNTAMNFLGVPYRRGGTSEDTGFDCSGFTRHIVELTLGLPLPRRADEQAKAPGLLAIKRDDLVPGDLVFFNTLRRTFSHVGIYVGEGKFIHSPRVGGEVRVEDMGLSYWARRFTGARRIDAPTATLPDPVGMKMTAPSLGAPIAALPLLTPFKPVLIPAPGEL